MFNIYWSLVDFWHVFSWKWKYEAYPLKELYFSKHVIFLQQVEEVKMKACNERLCFKMPVWFDVKHGLCLLTLKKDPGFQNQVHEETSPYLLPGAQDQWLGAEQDQLPCGSTGTSSGNHQETEICIVRACQAPQQPLKNHPSGHLGGWATPWSAEEMLHGQHQRVDIPAHARTAHNGFLQKRLGEDLCSIVPHVSPTTKSVIGLNWTELCGVKEDCRHLHLIWQWFNCSMLNLIDGLIYFMPDPLIDWFISCWIWSLSSSLLTYRGALNCCTLSLFYLSQLFCSVTLSSMNASCMQII